MNGGGPGGKGRSGTEGPDGKGTPSGFEAGRFVGLGLTLALSVLLFLGGGWWLDGRLGTTPLLTLVGTLVGAGAGFYYIYLEVVVRPGQAEGE